MNPAGKPDVVKPQVRFDEGGGGALGAPPLLYLDNLPMNIDLLKNTSLIIGFISGIMPLIGIGFVWNMHIMIVSFIKHVSLMKDQFV